MFSRRDRSRRAAALGSALTSWLVGALVACSSSTTDTGADPSSHSDNGGAPGSGATGDAGSARRDASADGGSSGSSGSGGTNDGSPDDGGSTQPTPPPLPSNCPTVQSDWNAYCNLMTPALQVAPGAMSSPIYGQVYSAGLTGDESLANCLWAEVGVGPVGTDPVSSLDWTWVNASFVGLTGIDSHNDEYGATITAPQVSTTTTYSYAYRFQAQSGEGGWSYCDTTDSSPGGFAPANDGRLTVTSSPTSRPVTWMQVSVGGTQTCGVRSDGTLWCWGATGATNQLTPARVGSWVDWTKVVTDGGEACGLRFGGSLWCWNVDTAPTPAQVGAGTLWTDVGLGDAFGCALASDETMWCWGSNSDGQFGNGTTTSQSQPVPAGPTNLKWKSLAVDADSVCGFTGRTVNCWGEDDYGQVGTPQPASGNFVLPPTWVYDQPPNDSFVSLFGGAQANCGVAQAVRGVMPSPLYCWGNIGQQDPNVALGGTPVMMGPPESGHEWGSVAVSPTHLCALMDDSKLYCLGDNLQGELGGGGPAQSGLGFEPVAGTWASVSVGYEGTCGIQLDGSLWCWGDNAFGQVGDGTTKQASAPVRISP